MASSEPVSVLRILVVILPGEENKTNDTGKTFVCFLTHRQTVHTDTPPAQPADRLHRTLPNIYNTKNILNVITEQYPCCAKACPLATLE